MDFLTPILNWIMSQVSLEVILKALISLLRVLATQTSNTVDDEAVNFLEMVFQSLGWISTSASPVNPPVISTGVSVPVVAEVKKK